MKKEGEKMFYSVEVSFEVQEEYKRIYLKMQNREVPQKSIVRKTFVTTLPYFFLWSLKNYAFKNRESFSTAWAR